MKSPIMVAALVVGTLGCLLVMVGMATTGWVTHPNGNNAGLFVLCQYDGCYSLIATGSLAAVRAFVVMGFFCSLAALIDGIVHHVKHVSKDIPNRVLPLVSAILYFIAAGLALLGAIIFAATMKDNFGGQASLGYSFALTIVGAIICGVAGGLTIYHRSSQSG